MYLLQIKLQFVFLPFKIKLKNDSLIFPESVITFYGPAKQRFFGFERNYSAEFTAAELTEFYKKKGGAWNSYRDERCLPLKVMKLSGIQNFTWEREINRRTTGTDIKAQFASITNVSLV